MPISGQFKVIEHDFEEEMGHEGEHSAEARLGQLVGLCKVPFTRSLTRWPRI